MNSDSAEDGLATPEKKQDSEGGPEEKDPEVSIQNQSEEEESEYDPLKEQYHQLDWLEINQRVRLIVKEMQNELV